MGQDSSVWYGAVIRGDSGRIVIGSRSNVQDGAVVHAETSIGSNVAIGHGATVHGGSIGDGALIGIHAAVLTGAVVLAGSIVAAGSVVLEGFEVPGNTLVAGVPARVVRETRPEERAELVRGCETYIDLAREHRRAWEGVAVGLGDP